MTQLKKRTEKLNLHELTDKKKIMGVKFINFD